MSYGLDIIARHLEGSGYRCRINNSNSTILAEVNIDENLYQVLINVYVRMGYVKISIPQFMNVPVYLQEAIEKIVSGLNTRISSITPGANIGPVALNYQDSSLSIEFGNMIDLSMFANPLERMVEIVKWLADFAQLARPGIEQFIESFSKDSGTYKLVDELMHLDKHEDRLSLLNAHSDLIAEPFVVSLFAVTTNLMSDLEKQDPEQEVTEAESLNHLVVEACNILDKSSKLTPNGKHMQSASYIYIARILRSKGKSDNAEEYLIRAKEILREIDMDDLIPDVYRELGDINFEGLRYPKSEEYYRLAISTYEKTDNREKADICKHNLGTVLFRQGRYAEAEETLSQALRAFSETDNNEMLAQCAVILANSHCEAGRYSDAHKLLHQYGQQIMQTDQFELLCSYKLCLANINKELERYHESRAIYEQVYYECTEAQFHEGIALSKWGLGSICIALSEFSDAKVNYAEAIQVFDDQELHHQKANCRINFAVALVLQGELRDGIELLLKARDECSQLSMSKEVAMCDLNIGVARLKGNDDDRALLSLLQARAQFSKLSILDKIASCNKNIAIILSEQNKNLEAMELLMQSMDTYKKLGMSDSQAQCQLDLVYIQLIEGAFAEAENTLKTLDATIESRSDNLKWQVLWLSGMLYSSPRFERRDESVALEYLSRAVEVVESLRSKQKTDLDKTRSLYGKTVVYSTMIGLLMTRKDCKQAYEYVERVKSRALHDLLEQASLDIISKESDSTGSGVIRASGHETEKAGESNNHVAGTLSIRPGITPEDTNGAITEVDFPSIVSRDSRSFNDISESLPPDTALIEYFLEGSVGYAFCFRGEEAEPMAIPLNLQAILPHTGLTERISEFHSGDELLDSFEDPDEAVILSQMLESTEPSIQSGILFVRDRIVYKAFDIVWEQSQASSDKKSSGSMRRIVVSGHAYQHLAVLYRELVRPFQNVIDSVNHVVVVPHGRLHLVPFSALIDVPRTMEGQAKELIMSGKANYLIEKCSLSMAPSASTLVRCRNIPRPKPDLCLAVSQPEYGADFPPIAYSCAIKEHFGSEKSTILRGSCATISNFISHANTEQPSVIHIEAHGVLNPGNGLSSYLAMSKATESGAKADPLYAVHILRYLRINACLVVLRICQSGLGKIYPGDDIVGLLRVFSYAGTPSILASLWEVEDKSSSDLIDGFYTIWLSEDGVSKSEALRLAQLETIGFARDLHEDIPPYNWAGFVTFLDFE